MTSQAKQLINKNAPTKPLHGAMDEMMLWRKSMVMTVNAV